MIYSDVAWGVAPCQMPGCGEAAEMLIDREELYCVRCFQLVVERLEAVNMNPNLREILGRLEL